MLRTRTLIGSLIVLVLFQAAGQKTDFKDDVFPELWSLSLDGQKSRLNEYLIEDPLHPFSLFRTAMIYEVNYRQANPLTDYEYAMANARKAESNYTRALNLVKADEVKSHDDYYAKVFNLYDAKGKPQVPFAVVDTRMRNGLDSARLFLATLPPIYKDFTRSISSYEKAVRSFSAINNRYATSEDLQMLYDEKLEAELLTLKRDYDSAIFYVNSFLKRSETFRPLGFSQKLSTRPVTTFRLDGFVTVLNFLVGNIRLWDYGAWVDGVMKVNKTEVADLRNKYTSAIKSLDAVLDQISSSTPQSLPKPFKVDKQIIFNLGKYDKPSFLAGLLHYKSYLQDWRLAEKGRIVDTALTENNAAILTSLVYDSRRADTLLNDLKALVSPHNLAKHKAFIQASFGTDSGVTGYMSAQSDEIRNKFTTYANGLRRNLSVERRLESFRPATPVLKHGNQTLSFDTATPLEDQMKAGKLVVHTNYKNQDGSAFLMGEFFHDKARTMRAVFATHVSSEGHVGWFKTFTLHIDSGVVNDAHTRIGPSLLLQDGMVFLLRAEHISRGESQWWMVGVNSHGDEKFRRLLPDHRVPRQLLYSERSNGFVLAQRGLSDAEDPAVEEPVVLTHLNALGEIDWHREFSWKGKFTGMFDLSDGYGLVGNYVEVREISGKVHRTTGPDRMSPFLVRMNAGGEVMLVKPIVIDQPIQAIRVVRLGDNGIHLLGQSTGQGTLPPHVMTNKIGQVICSSY